MAIQIRLAEQVDLIQIVDMQEAHRLEVKLSSGIIFNRELCIENMRGVIDNPLHLILVAHQPNSAELLGYTWLVIFQPHFSYNFYLSEVYTYIVPAFRNASVLMRLINKSKLISRNMGANHLQFGSFSGNKKLSKAYHKRYKLVGEVFNINLRG